MADIRAFGSESEAAQVQTEVARRLRRLRSDAEATFECHLLNGIQRLVREPKDGTTVVDYHAEFGITPAAEVDFDLGNASPGSGVLRKRCQALIESVEESLGGLATGAVTLRVECGSASRDLRASFVHEDNWFRADSVACRDLLEPEATLFGKRHSRLIEMAVASAATRGRGGQLRHC
ncbi:MAG: major capsid protein [Pseudomonadota bacterium]